ncbi:hypothetical protein CCR94_05080 [Rhodoblastus sphagnicola]|uniref:Uncharacterized protein n=1 Tax=Rhodoblastus sphagnicola TaxID=333368 RepID=A0A2S6ND55_9HYPH|nr:DUF6212 domain-containing protein [Rhodoblastus sphagnicola]MBB4198009.1 hypothetical protein [Rhodoblastus sphagnicola]PPQ32556.1 hypothetical protein CCR94_05080 [Rhodoblastus sphagnicola]
MAELLVATNDLADFFDASSPAVLVGPAFFAAFRKWESGWRVFAARLDESGDFRVTQDLDRALSPHVDPALWTRAPSFPAHILALLDSAPLALDAFASHLPPPVITVATAEDALARFAALLTGEISANAVALTQARAALSELRRENETLHGVMACALQALGGGPMGAARLVFASGVAAEGGPVHAAPEGRALARQTLSLPLQNLTTISLRIAEARCSSQAWLKVRLLGASAGLIHGSWLIEGDALRPGWLGLDLRFVLGDLMETAQIEIETLLPMGDALALSLDPAETEPFLALQSGGAPVPRGLALRVHRGDFGRRTLAPLYWNGSDIGCSAAFDQMPLRLAPRRWSEIGVIEGAVDFVALGGEPPRPVLALTPEQPATIGLSALNFPGCDVLEIGLTLLRNPAQAIRFLAELRADGVDIDPQPWRRLGGSTDLFVFALEIPSMDSGFDLRLTAELVEGAGPALLELTSIAGLRLQNRPRPRLHPPARAGATRPWEEELRARAPAEICSGVLVDHLLRNADDYAHIDLTVYDLNIEEAFYPAIRFKLVKTGASPALEFRRLPDWPGGFDVWPDLTVDAYGSYVRVRPEAEELDRLLAMMSERDGRMMRTLASALPQIVAMALHDPRLADEDSESWAAAAAQFAELAQVRAATLAREV